MGPQPFFKDNEAEKNLMIVVPTRCMLAEKFVHSLWAKILVDSGVAIQQRVSHSVVDCTAEPLVHNIHGKSAFRPFQD